LVFGLPDCGLAKQPFVGVVHINMLYQPFYLSEFICVCRNNARTVKELVRARPEYFQNCVMTVHAYVITDYKKSSGVEKFTVPSGQLPVQAYVTARP
jgi:hypothetical protein